MEQLTRLDLLTMQTQGFGYLSHPCRSVSFYVDSVRANIKFSPYAAIEMRDDAVIAAANKMKMSHDELALFADSKAGRWLGDSLHDNLDALQIRETAYSAIAAWVIKARS